LSAVHFSEAKLVDTPKGNKQFNYMFSLLAVFILMIALLNYINLSTAKSTERAREVGIRKVIGAGRFQLIRQFLLESVLLIAAAWIIALLLVQVALPFFNQLLQTQLTVNWWQAIVFMGSILCITLLLAGLYPAFVLSSFKPVKVLKGHWRHSSKGLLLRKSITFVQFAIAAALILGTTVIYQQLHFIEHKDLGFNKDNLLSIYLPRDSVYMNAVKVFQNELKQRPEIAGVTIGSGLSSDGMTLASTTVYSNGKKREIMCRYSAVDTSFIPLFQIKLLEGRNFSKAFGTDEKEAFIVNEAFVKAMGWKTAIGQTVEAWGHNGKVIAVMKNFYYKSLHNAIEPLAIVMNIFPANTTNIKVKPKDLPLVKGLFKQHFSSLPFDYSFMDESVEKQYVKDRITMRLFNYFTVLAVFISCLGLYGLVALISVQRTKEIGIRKVLGASILHLFSLQAKGYLTLVCWALAIALPVAGIAMNKWLAAYAYHVQLTWWMFLTPVLIIPLIALLVISREVIRMALLNPVVSLKTE
jgi:putative ABC transport system permease protein